jgi:hypothetical protein
LKRRKTAVRLTRADFLRLHQSVESLRTLVSRLERQVEDMPDAVCGRACAGLSGTLEARAVAIGQVVVAGMKRELEGIVDGAFAKHEVRDVRWKRGNKTGVRRA